MLVVAYLPVILSVFPPCAQNVRNLNNLQKSYFIAKTINLIKILSPFDCLGYTFFSVKWPQITRFLKKCREIESVKIIPYLSVALNAEIHVIYI